jgi:hypothetical protein
LIPSRPYIIIKPRRDQLRPSAPALPGIATGASELAKQKAEGGIVLQFAVLPATQPRILAKRVASEFRIRPETAGNGHIVKLGKPSVWLWFLDEFSMK